jgi:hypothetical protein
MSDGGGSPGRGEAILLMLTHDPQQPIETKQGLFRS